MGTQNQFYINIQVKCTTGKGCWTSDLENAKTGVEKYLQQTKNKKIFK